MTASLPRLLVLASTYPRWSNDPEPGFVHELAKRLTDRFHVRVLCPHAPGAAERETLDGVEVVRYRYAPAGYETLVSDGGIMTNLKRHPWKRLLVIPFLVGLGWRTWREMRRWKPDVIHAHWLIPQGLTAALLKLAFRDAPPYIVTSHGADLFALRAPVLQALKRFTARRASALTVVSQVMKDHLVDMGVPSEKISVQPMGVDLRQRFTPDENIPRSTEEILFVGRLVEKKGLPCLIAAMPDILKRFPRAYLSIAGFGPDEQACREQARQLGISDKVHFLGALPQAELPALYRRAALFVAPFTKAKSGDQEGLGLVLVEALGCGCPVVVTDLPACKDVVGIVEGVRTVPPDRHDLLSEAICACLENAPLSIQNVKTSLPALREHFDWDNVARGYAEKLQTVRNCRPRGHS